MKVVDPQSALLSNAEVYDFLKPSKQRTADKKIGAYEPVKLEGYRAVRQDVQTYINETAPLTASFPPPESYMNEVVKRLRQFGLTKTEVFSIINLGIGLPVPVSASNGEDEGMEVDDQGEAAAEDDTTATHSAVGYDDDNEDLDAVDEDDTVGRELLRAVVDSLDERFPGDEGEDKIQALLKVLRDCITVPSANGANGSDKPPDAP